MNPTSKEVKELDKSLGRISGHANASESSLLALRNQGLSAEEIAESLSLEVGAVKHCLLENSPEYRRRNNKQKRENITDEEEEQLFAAYKDLAMNSENEHIREKALRWLISEKKGYNDPKRNIVPLNGGINFLVLNESLKTLNTKRLGALPTIDIEP